MTLSPITTSLMSLSSLSSSSSSPPQQSKMTSPQQSKMTRPLTPSSSSTTAPSPPSPISSSSSSSSSTSIVPSIMAGYVSGICAVVVGHPMDSAKVWMQTNTNMQHIMIMTSSSSSTSKKTSSSSPRVTASSSPSATAAPRGANMSTLAALTIATNNTNTTIGAKELPPWRRNIMYSWRMIRALYAGVTGPLMTVGAIQSLNFAVYETTRRELHYYQQHVLLLNNNSQKQQQQQLPPQAFDRDADSLWNVAIAGGTSGVVLSFVTVPFLMIKTTSQVRGIGFRSALHEVLRVARLSSSSSSFSFVPPFYRVGFGIHSLIEITSRTVYYATYEGCKRTLRRHREDRVQTEESWTTTAPTVSSNTLVERMISAALAGIGCWAIIFPLDSIRSRMLAQMAAAGQVGGHTTTTTTTATQQVMVAWDMTKHMYQQGIGASSADAASAAQRLRRGLQPFFRGFGVTVLRAGPVAAAALPVYDMVLEHVSRNYYN